MASNGGFDPLAQYARLSERVENQGKDIVDLRSNMNTGFQTINANLNALSNELRNNTKTQWPVIWSAAGVCSAMLIAAGTFVYGTLGTRLERTDASVAALATSTVSRQEMDWRQARGMEDRASIQGSVKEVRDAQVPRDELARTWQNYDQRFLDQQRQLDELKAVQAGIYGARDVILEMRENQQRFDAELSKIRTGSSLPR